MDVCEIVKFEAKYQVEPNTGCWLWIGNTQNEHYGMFWCGSKRAGTHRKLLAHRVSYEHYKGPIPSALEIDHLCRTRQCVNPDHLEAVTHSENVRRGGAAERWRNITHCPQGHEYSGRNLGGRPGKRTCRACQSAATRRYQARKAEASR